MRIAHLRRVYPLTSETFIADPIATLGRLGFDSHMISLVRTGDSGPESGSSALIRTSAYWPGLASRQGLSEVDQVLWPALRVWLTGVVRRLRPDALWAHFGPEGCLIAPVAQRLRVPLMVSFYGYDLSRLAAAGSGWPRRYRELGASGHCLHVVSEHLRSQLIDCGIPAERIFLNPLGVDLDRFAYRDPAEDFDGRHVKVLYVGRLTEKKAPGLLLRAFAKAYRRLRPAVELSLTLCGDGPERAACEQLILDLGLSRCVKMTGRVTHARVPSLMHSHHIYAQHCVTATDGDSEGFGVTFAEASACGLPIVSSRHPGTRDILEENRNCLLVDEGDIAGTADALAELATSPSAWTALGAWGRRLVAHRYSVRRYAAHQGRTLSVLSRTGTAHGLTGSELSL